MFVYIKEILWALNSDMLKLSVIPSLICKAADHVTENDL